MPLDWTAILLIILSYLLGSIPFGYLIVQFKKGLDVRTVGSGNIGATNVLRTAGTSGGLLTLALDLIKGYLAVCATSYWTHQFQPAVALSAMAVILGHAFPVYLKFKGGKGVATGAGIFLCLAIGPSLGAMGVFLVVVLIWRYASLGSILAAAAFPFLYVIFKYRQEPSLWILSAALFCSGLVICRHHENIKRLVAGTENKFADFTK